ncbi:hypothetical protein [Nocardia otitidiscaviarum]|uniref:hypothetical protein n=1 Tax=Nocardia otitidiscaviarum TaxID=1823 RepID=UPI001895F97B|nr:hypothetical protein [Nocardia otitidiscaviarum]MBF6238780.1 hypothetical protein [Nocardia otitidiscaviarum]
MGRVCDMGAVRVDAVRWAGDEPQPGLVEVRLIDAHGTAHSFVEKEPIFGSELPLRPDTAYPVRARLGCTVLDACVVRGRELVTITTALPYGIESEGGRTEFEVTPDQLTD